MRDRPVADLAALPLHGKLSASVTRWGTLSFMLIEDTGFALVLAIYFYLASLAIEWPIGAPPPDLGPGTIVTLILLASIVPNWFVIRWAEQEQVNLVRIRHARHGAVRHRAAGLPLVRIPGLARWDSNAYGSITWTLLGLHSTHLVTDLIDTAVLGALMFTQHGYNKRRLGDVQDNALYWYFVVLTWLPIYAVIYWGPRL